MTSTSLAAVLSGGGTGGHILPAVAIGNGIKSKHPSARIVFMGSNRGPEEKIVRNLGFEFKGHGVGPLTRGARLSFVAFGIRLATAAVGATVYLFKMRPGVVIGTGGYASAPAVIAAGILGAPVILQEQNLIPGRATVLLSRFADAVCVAFEDTKDFLANGERARVTGNPLRLDIRRRPRDEAARSFNLSPEKTTLLFLGGSRGARSINKALIESSAELAGLGVQVIASTGTELVDEVRTEIKRHGIEAHVSSFIPDMSSAYCASDLVISRAGAMTLSEISYFGLPSVLIPYPYAAEGHQEANARWYEQRGASLVLLDSELGRDSLMEKIRTLWSNPDRMRQAARASRSLARDDATESIVDLALGMCDTDLEN
jgi:UDP-N-acetylglucosamine--N-acetylmuramyl-(pentapeptide) pyrophosphoryl-undecaprenol N-acetylglucosamine transferase